MVFGKELSGQISFAAAEFYAKDFWKAGHRHFADALLFHGTVLGTSVLQHGILPMPFLFLWFSDRRPPFCFPTLTFLLSDACLFAFLILYFTHRSFDDLVLCHGGFQGPPDMGRFQRSRWTSDGHFSGRICTAGQRVKRPVWTRRTVGESTPAAADEGDGG